MADLETELRAAVKNGFLSLTLSKEWEGDKWITNYRTTDSLTHHNTRHVDPVESVRMALRSGTKESKSAVKSPRPKTRDMEDLL